jgi:hypothetical protein
MRDIDLFQLALGLRLFLRGVKYPLIAEGAAPEPSVRSAAAVRINAARAPLANRLFNGPEDLVEHLDLRREPGVEGRQVT